eukprot:TRINITY_DN8959_c1_g1_i3.p1 TRINITY_DN8959_c1_g1~~TRINITY_DN8959_c1_g1_i3.p1  ORF type:complete len:182 (+),score=13.08 TRINITY_DN8959_c1_g1_i3:1-546(+)
MEGSSLESEVKVVAKSDHYPMSIVWCPLPLLSWFLPFIGHIGISLSDGTICDFGGSYYIHQDPHRLVFGPVIRYLPVTPGDIDTTQEDQSYTDVAIWDEAVDESNVLYCKKTHNLLCQNCHDHAAVTLNRLKYKNFTHWNTLTIILYMFAVGHFVSPKRTLIGYLPFVILIILFIILGVVF